jgi:calcineurin-like phosphoesterase family protein
MPASQDHMQLSKAAFGCFVLEHFPQTNDNHPRKRAKFTPQRRKEVALLRGKACLRCRLLKLRVRSVVTVQLPAKVF